MFPPGDHPLEGVPNFGDLAVPETLSVKVNLSEVRREDGHGLLFGSLESVCWRLRLVCSLYR